MQDDPNENHPNQPVQQSNPLGWSPVTDAMRHGQHELVTKQGNPIDPPDPGSSITRLIATLAAVVLVLIVVVWQNSSDSLKYKYLLGQSEPIVELKPDEPAPGNFGQIDPIARMFVRGYGVFKSAPIAESIDPGGASPLINEDRVRLIMLAGEYEGNEPALKRLNDLRAIMLNRSTRTEDPVEQDELVIAELNALETLYTTGPDALEDSQRDQLTARYGLVAKFALTHGLDDTDPARAPLIDGGTPIILFILLAGTVILLAPLLGLIALIFGIVYLATGRLKWRNHVPAKGGSVFLETYGLFVGAFIVMSVGTFFVLNSSMPELASFSLFVQWLLLLTVLWGLARGMRATNWRKAIGWHTGEGVFKEIGCGIIAYLATLPLFIAGALVTIILLTIQGIIQTKKNHGVSPDPEAFSNPIFEVIASGNFITIGLIFLLVTTWAPIVEEAIFRGALYRHLRSSMHWVFAALLSATLFAFMHSYGPLMVTPIIALGFMFAFMREWRGSLIASMTAHFLHNFTLVAFMILFVQLIKDPM
jgi:membrane protease YdiL (CAAX protease family)